MKDIDLVIERQSLMDLPGYAMRRARNLYFKTYTLLVKHRFRALKTHLDPRVEITNPQFVSIGYGAIIRPYSWIYAIRGDREVKDVFIPSIEIGNYCSIGRFCHITASNQVILEDYVLIGEGVLIADNIHGYEDIKTPIIRQALVSRGPIVIGNGTWIGNGARIVGKARIGRNCVIGANAFVNRDVPDYCMVVGIPGRIVKRFDSKLECWLAVDEPLISRSHV
jgi:acetyltransferase-like isoleucine patch superfamily enzyme